MPLNVNLAFSRGYLAPISAEPLSGFSQAARGFSRWRAPTLEPRGDSQGIWKNQDKSRRAEALLCVGKKNDGSGDRLVAGNRGGLSQGQVHALYRAGTVAGLTDGQLLERFATRRDEGAELAFSALVERHGPMVLRACHGILHDHHHAMDAFQATFLVLARKGESLWVLESLGPWLHRVACRAAGRVRSAEARRKGVEARAAELAETRVAKESSRELLAAIHEEVNGLPERYRSTIVLCDLEGRTCEEAARHLGCPVGTVGSRLARGRQQLRERLRRRGFEPGIRQGVGTEKRERSREPMPAGLVASTAGAATQFASTQAVLQGTAASLALEVLKLMAMTRWWKAASILFVLCASTSGVVSLAARNAAVDEPAAKETVAAAPFKGTVLEQRGVLEASSSADVYSMVEGQATIITLLPEGTRVTKGQLVCELDSAPLKDQLVNQTIAAKVAQTALEEAKLASEVAAISLKEYTEGLFPKELLTAVSEIDLAKLAITRAQEQLKRAQAAREQLNALVTGQGGMKAPSDVVAMLDVEDRIAAATQTIEREQRAIEIGRARRELLEKYTKEKTIKHLRSELEKALILQRARNGAWELEQLKIKKLEHQIANCRLLAPSDGVLLFANDPHRVGNRPQAQIEEGAAVRERQKIFSIPDLERPMRVTAKIPESKIDLVRPGLEAKVKVDAFADVTFSGTVTDVAPLPDPSSFFERNVKVYTVHVILDKGLPGLRPGFTAQVDIRVSEADGEPRKPSESTKDVSQPKPKGKGSPIPAALRAKWRALSSENRLKTAGASVEERDTILKEAGFSDDEIRQLKAALQRTLSPR